MSILPKTAAFLAFILALLAGPFLWAPTGEAQDEPSQEAAPGPAGDQGQATPGEEPLAPGADGPPEGDEWIEFCGSAGPDEIRKAIADGADANHVAPGGLTPLLSAAAFNPDVAAVEALLDAGANIEAVEGRFGLNALMLAASHNPLPAMVDLLVAKGIPVDRQNFQGGTALIQAASSNPNPAVSEALVRAGADLETRDSLGATPLMHAAGYGNAMVIRRLLELKADPLKADEAGDTALAWAARSNVDSGAVFELLRAGADPKTRNLRGFSPLYHAAVNPNSDVLAILLEASGGDLSLLRSPESSALFAATYFNPNVNVARRLIALGADVNEPHTDGMTILMASIVNPEPAMTKLILAQRADPNATDSFGRTPLMLAAALARDPMVVRLLLGAGADPALKDKEGKTAVDYAEGNDTKAVSQLFDRFRDDDATEEEEAEAEAPQPGAE
ncbi:MAG: ankyrin repeat domain-containing protein [Deltaproteobacteria bacterium]|nr:ankyrin repeat domain-containing protein [Deltaproteobacteria bacterium]